MQFNTILAICVWILKEVKEVKRKILLTVLALAVVLLATPLVGTIYAAIPIHLPKGTLEAPELSLVEDAPDLTAITIGRKDLIRGMTWTGACYFRLEDQTTRDWTGELTLEIIDYVYDRETGEATIIFRVMLDFTSGDKGTITGIIQRMGGLETPLPGPEIAPEPPEEFSPPEPETRFHLYLGTDYFRGVEVRGIGDLTFDTSINRASMTDFEGAARMPRGS
jgi:hypothetical protein